MDTVINTLLVGCYNSNMLYLVYLLQTVQPAIGLFCVLGYCDMVDLTLGSPLKVADDADIHILLKDLAEY